MAATLARLGGFVYRIAEVARAGKDFRGLWPEQLTGVPHSAALVRDAALVVYPVDVLC